MATVRMTQNQAWSSAYSTTDNAASGSNSENTTGSHRPSRAVSTSLAIDTYAQSVLEQHCVRQDVQIPDDSLGPYITSLLRASDIVESGLSVESLDEFDSLQELLQEHCGMNEAEAAKSLQKIATSVRTGHIPAANDEYGTSGFETMEILRNALPENNNNTLPIESTTTGTTTAAGIHSAGSQDDDENFPPSSIAVSSCGISAAESLLISPTQADTLIPFDLLGVDDDPDPSPSPKPNTRTRAGSSASGSSSGGSRLSQGSQQQQENGLPVPPEQQHQQQKQQDAFPPLGTPQVATTRKKSAGSSNASTSKNSKAKKSNKKASHRGTQASELAAMLFQPARPRISSIDEEGQAATTPDTSPNMIAQPTPLMQDVPTASTGSATSVPTAPGAGSTVLMDEEQQQYQQLQWHAVVEMLLSMNHDISEEVAGVAADTAYLDVNVAQYLIDEASSAAPVCRHLLTSGCYRSDCTFSHDVLGHTCVFWLRGRCGKGDSCRFLHGFNEKLMQDIYPQAAQQQMMMMSPPQPMYSTSADVPPEQAPYSHPSASGMMHAFDLPQQQQVLAGGAYSSSSSSYPKSGGFVGGGASWEPPAVTNASWELPTATEVSAGPPASSSSAAAPSSTFSFANIASQGYNDTSSFPRSQEQPGPATPSVVPTVRIPQDLWNPHENRDSSLFHIADPIERYRKVALTVRREDILDLHFQSTKTFPFVLSTILPEKLAHSEEVWIVMGTGHHVGSKTHQKGGGALETSVVSWLTLEGYVFARGRDRNGQGGAVLVKR
jgi:hypothetical protein